jgi:hypothetical protein
MGIDGKVNEIVKKRGERPNRIALVAYFQNMLGGVKIPPRTTYGLRNHSAKRIQLSSRKREREFS